MEEIAAVEASVGEPGDGAAPATASSGSTSESPTAEVEEPRAELEEDHVGLAVSWQMFRQECERAQAIEQVAVLPALKTIASLGPASARIQPWVDAALAAILALHELPLQAVSQPAEQALDSALLQMAEAWLSTEVFTNWYHPLADSVGRGEWRAVPLVTCAQVSEILERSGVGIRGGLEAAQRISDRHQQTARAQEYREAADAQLLAEEQLRAAIYSSGASAARATSSAPSPETMRSLLTRVVRRAQDSHVNVLVALTPWADQLDANAWPLDVPEEVKNLPVDMHLWGDGGVLTRSAQANLALAAKAASVAAVVHARDVFSRLATRLDVFEADAQQVRDPLRDFCHTQDALLASLQTIVEVCGAALARGMDSQRLGVEEAWREIDEALRVRIEAGKVATVGWTGAVVASVLPPSVDEPAGMESGGMAANGDPTEDRDLGVTSDSAHTEGWLEDPTIGDEQPSDSERPESGPDDDVDTSLDELSLHENQVPWHELDVANHARLTATAHLNGLPYRMRTKEPFFVIVGEHHPELFIHCDSEGVILVKKGRQMSFGRKLLRLRRLQWYRGELEVYDAPDDQQVRNSMRRALTSRSPFSDKSAKRVVFAGETARAEVSAGEGMADDFSWQALKGVSFGEFWDSTNWRPARKEFYEFLTERKSTECFDFLVEVELLPDQVSFGDAMSVYNRYIRPGAPSELNVGGLRPEIEPLLRVAAKHPDRPLVRPFAGPEKRVKKAVGHRGDEGLGLFQDFRGRMLAQH